MFTYKFNYERLSLKNVNLANLLSQEASHVRGAAGNMSVAPLHAG